MRRNGVVALVFLVAALATGAQTPAGTPALRLNAHASFYARRASATVPESVRVMAGGAISVILNRGSKAKGEARVVFVHEADGKVVHDSGWLEVTPLRRLKLPTEKIAPATWRIDVYDRMNGGPTGEIPYALDVDLMAANAPDGTRAVFQHVPSNKVFSPSYEYPIVECNRLSEPKSVRPGSTLELIAASDVALDLVPHVVVAPGGRNLYVEVTNTSAKPVEVALFAKEISHFRFVPVCRCVVSQKRQTVVATIPWDRVIRPLWRIETRAPVKQQNASKAALRIHRDNDPERASFDSENSSAYSYLTSRFVCESGSRSMQKPTPMESSGSHMFERVTAIDVSTGGHIAEADRDALATALTDALAIWSAECRTCNYDALSVASINGKRYLRRDIYEELDSMLPIGTSARGGPPLPPFALTTKVFSRARLLKSGSAPFNSVAPGDRAMSTLCTYPLAELPPHIRRVRASLRCAVDAAVALSTENTLRITLLLQDGPTACGDSPNIVACEADRELLELNGRDYRFQIGPRGLGSGSRAVDLHLVMLHEVGHWLGLDHSSGSDDIMAATVQLSRCITTADALRLSEALVRTPSRRSDAGRAFRWSQ